MSSVGDTVTLRGTGSRYSGRTYSATVVDIRQSDGSVKVCYATGGFKRFSQGEFRSLLVSGESKESKDSKSTKGTAGYHDLRMAFEHAYSLIAANRSEDTSNPYIMISEFFEQKAKELAESKGKSTFQHGYHLLHNAESNIGLAFNIEERDRLGLHGLLPATFNTMAQQERRVMWNLSRIKDNLDKYKWLMNLSQENLHLFYRVAQNNIKTIMPLVYTPTVGKACQEFGHIFTRPSGIFLTINDLGNVRNVLCNWPRRDVRAIVFTDGERILGLGDLGACGMGIPIGKLMLYTAIAGVPPEQCLPVHIDTGTENKAFLDDEMYIGLKRRRVRDETYDALILEFLTAAADLFGPDCILQFEDFGNRNAFRMLDMHRNNFNTFNDDIQGTASVVLAGIFSATTVSGTPLQDQKFLFLGAGSAGLGIGELVATAITRETKQPIEQSRAQMFFMDSRGLIYNGRASGGISAAKRPFAHEIKHDFDTKDIVEVIRQIRPTGLIGVSAQGGAFNTAALTLMGQINEQPLIFPLSNPTSKAECTAAAAYTATQGRALFASGSPFDPVTINGKTLTPGQGNNAFIFPGLALGVMVSKTRRIPDDLFIIAARTLAGLVSPDDRARGNLYPDISAIGESSVHIAVAVANRSFELNIANAERPGDMLAAVRAFQYNPSDIRS